MFPNASRCTYRKQKVLGVGARRRRAAAGSYRASMQMKLNQLSGFDGLQQKGKEHIIQVKQDVMNISTRKQQSSKKQIHTLKELDNTSKTTHYKEKKNALRQEQGYRKLDIKIDVLDEKIITETKEKAADNTMELEYANSQLLLDHNTVRNIQHIGKETIISSKEAPQVIDRLLEETLKIWLSLQNVNRKDHGEYTIFKVPDNIRLNDNRASEPMIVPIGPYHHVHKRLSFREMESHKPECISYLLSVAPHEGEENELKSRCLSILKELETEARSCYSDNTRFMESEHFTEMLLRDGCFIIYLLLRQQEIDETESTFGNRRGACSPKEIRKPIIDTHKLSDIKLDLLKLENQIPLFVIKKLFQFIMPNMPPSALVDLILKFFDDVPLSKTKSVQNPNIDEVHHLLHLMHMSLAPSTVYQTISSENWDPELPFIIDAPTWIPSAKELQESGVKFRGKKESSSLMDITFNEGTVEMPILNIYNSTALLISNLVAFEKCYRNAGDYITSYVAFLNCLMHGEEDVRLLHLNGIVINKMTTDKKVAEFFRRICPEGPLPSKPNHLHNLFIKVKEHHTRKKNRWMAEAKAKYCSSPWVSLSVFGGLCLLLLTFLQTTFTIIQTVHDLKGH